MLKVGRGRGTSGCCNDIGDQLLLNWEHKTPRANSPQKQSEQMEGGRELYRRKGDLCAYNSCIFGVGPRATPSTDLSG